MSRSRGVQRLGRATDNMSAVARQKAAGRLCAVRAGLPGLCQRHRRCARPQIPGLAPGGLGPHRTSSGSPAGFPPVSRLPAGLSPFARRPLVSLRPAFSGSVPSAAARFRFSVGFPPGSLPWAIFTLALPRAGSAGAGPGRQGPRSPVLPRPPRLDHAIRPHCRWAAAGHDGMPPQNRLLPAAASAAHRRARTARAVHARDAARTATTQRDRRAASLRCAGRRDRGPVQIVSSGWPCWLAWLSALTWPASTGGSPHRR